MTTEAYAMNTFASEALNGFTSFQLVFVHDPPDLTSLSFPKIDTIPVTYREYYNLLLARAQMVGRLLLEWRTQQALEFENKNRQFTNEEIFKDDQMVYLLAPHSSELQTSSMKFRQDFIGQLFIDTALDKTLQAERCYWTLIGQHISCESYQEKFSAHTTGHSEHI